MVKDRVLKVKEEMSRLESAIQKMCNESDFVNGSYWGPKQTGAVRRASMDLTRALAELRRHN